MAAGYRRGSGGKSEGCVSLDLGGHTSSIRNGAIAIKAVNRLIGADVGPPVTAVMSGKGALLFSVVSALRPSPGLFIFLP